jgi:hypothetical protein
VAIPAPGPRPERTETGTDPSSSPTPAGSPTRSDQRPNRWFPTSPPPNVRGRGRTASYCAWVGIRPGATFSVKTDNAFHQ